MRILGWLVLGTMGVAPGGCGGGGGGWTLVAPSDGSSVTGRFDAPIGASTACRR